MNQIKSFLTSKLFWLGLATVAIAGLQMFVGGGDLAKIVTATVNAALAQLGFSGTVEFNANAWINGVIGVAIIVLRRFTTGGMTFALPEKKIVMPKYEDAVDGIPELTLTDEDKTPVEFMKK